LGIETKYKRNILVEDPTEFDKNYVQVMPSISFTVMPQILYQEDRNYFNKVSYGVESRFTSFKQDRLQESTYLRNVSRTEVYPYLQVNWANNGPINLSSKFSLEYQQYDFHDEEQKSFYKNTNLVTTELSFTMDRIFGLAYEEVYQKEEFKEKDLLKFKNQKADTKEKKKVETNLIGDLPNFEDSLAKEKFIVLRNSYRHSQEFNFIHHQILDSDENGNETFLNQIQTEDGWFDDNDVIKRDLGELESSETRQSLPINNTFELQWNNSLIKKTPQNYHYLKDGRYLKDTFSYSKIGHFNLSQGYLFNSTESEFYQKLTRLLLDTSYSASTWNLNLKDYYFHQGGDHILSFSGQKRFDRLSTLAVYNFNSLDNSNIKTVKAGFQFRPHDVLGFSYLEEYDLDAQEKIQSIYQVDFIPHNN
jgi:LPS-assembly protein